jgi:hypothetical protein
MSILFLQIYIHGKCTSKRAMQINGDHVQIRSELFRNYIIFFLIILNYDKEDQHGKAAPTRTSNKNQWQGAQENP